MKITLDVRSVVPDFYTALIISHPTGVWYEAQVAGMACMHPECEGFVINMGDYMMDFNDHNGLCGILGTLAGPENYMESDLAIQKEMAQKIDKELSEWSAKAYKVRFDFDRVNELTEGWWPVIVSGNVNSIMVPGDFREWKGYIHTSNCD